MEAKKYQKIVDKYIPKEEKTNNLLTAFLTGGLIGLLGNFLMVVTLIFIACLLTGLGVFDNLVKKGKMGLIIPITGFAHSMQSAILDYKKEGPVYGFGANVFKLAGSVILYGVVSAYVFGMIRYLFFGG